MSGPIYLCDYTTGEGRHINIRLDNDRALAGGFNAGDPANGPAQPLHGRYLKCRGVYGKLDTGKRMFLPCPSEGRLEAIFEAGTFNVAGDDYTVTGKRGEHESLAVPLP